MEKPQSKDISKNNRKTDMEKYNEEDSQYRFDKFIIYQRAPLGRAQTSRVMLLKSI
jgi:hypothetical protein